MRLFDNFIDSFSAKDLRSRVTGVIIVGFLTCAAASAGLYFLLISHQTISISGVGNWSKETSGAITISLSTQDLKYVGDMDELLVRLDDPGDGVTAIETKVLSINPAAPSITVDASGIPPKFAALTSFDVSIILFEEPLWRMLWGKG